MKTLRIAQKPGISAKLGGILEWMAPPLKKADSSKIDDCMTKHHETAYCSGELIHKTLMHSKFWRTKSAGNSFFNRRTPE